jgi:hypothetical protein
LLAIALGRIGISYNDFIALTPFEFNKIYDSWYKWQEQMMRERWEQTRFIAMTNITPHSRKKLKATDIIRFPWDVEKKQKNSDTKKSTRERFEALKNIIN